MEAGSWEGKAARLIYPGGDAGTGPITHQEQLSQQDALVSEPWGGELGFGMRSW